MPEHELLVSPTLAEPPERMVDIAAVLFDVDGVIADTAKLHEMAWRRMADRERLPFDESLGRSLRGLSREASLRRILGDRRVPLARFEQMMDSKNAEYVALIDQLTPRDILPGVVNLLNELNEFGVHLAAVSASRNARQVLERLQLTESFAAIIDGADEIQSLSKLHRFLLAAASLRVEPARCLVIEDSSAGIAAARQFGMITIGLGDRSSLAAATLVFESLRGVEARCLFHWLATI